MWCSEIDNKNTELQEFLNRIKKIKKMENAENYEYSENCVLVPIYESVQTCWKTF